MTNFVQRAVDNLQGKSHAWLSTTFASRAPGFSRVGWALLVFAMLGVIGVLDYFSGYQISFAVFYLLPIAIAAVTLGWAAAVLVAVVSVVISLLGDIAAGGLFQTPAVYWWNGAVMFASYLVVIWLLTTLLDMYKKVVANQHELELRVRERTAALTEEMAERERLEQVVLEIGRRERVAIGQDLHDSLGQHLTGTAFAAQLLASRLAQRQAEEAEDARKIAAYVRQAIEETRLLAKGLLTAEVEPNGLPAALTELANVTRQQFQVACAVRCAEDIKLPNGAAAHLYRIAQEAIANAMKHSRCQLVDIALGDKDGRWTLSIADDGTGIPKTFNHSKGLGLRIMAHRAAIIGAQFTIEPREGGGIIVTCRGPSPHPQT